MSRRQRRGKSGRQGGRGAGGTLTLLAQTEGLTPGMQKKVVPVRGPILPRKEVKYIDTAVNNYATDTTGSVTLLNGVALGDDNNGRTGRQAQMRSVAIAGRVYVNSAGSSQIARLLLVWDNSNSLGTPAVTDVLSAANSASFHKVDAESRFTILWDHPVALFLYDGCRPVFAQIPLAAITQYAGTGATAASIENGAIFLVTIGDTAAGTGASTFSGAMRVRFTDED